MRKPRTIKATMPSVVFERTQTIKKGTMAQSVADYLKEYFEKRKAICWRNLCNAKPDFNVLLQIQASAKEISLLEQEILVDEYRAQEAQKHSEAETTGEENS
jgi:hypothetical protein